MKLPQRKRNRLLHYDYSSNGAYFVTICTNGRRKLLCDIDTVGDGFPVPKSAGIIAAEMIEAINGKYPAVSVDNYVVMPNHIHLLLRIEQAGGTGNPSPTLGMVVGWYKYQTTKRIREKLGIKERIFQRSYHDHVIRGQADYDMIWQYICNNPLNWEKDCFFC